MKLRKKIKQQREILEIIWEDKSWTRRSWIRGVCKQCKDGIFGEEELRDHFYERTCWRCRKNTAARETTNVETTNVEITCRGGPTALLPNIPKPFCCTFLPYY